MSVYDETAFRERVEHAARAIAGGTWEATQTRAFDTCFEMYDGDLVVTALIRRGRRDPVFDAALTTYLTPNREHWEKTAAEYADVPDRQLPALSRHTIRQAIRHREKEYARRLQEATA